VTELLRPFTCDYDGCDKPYKMSGDLNAHKRRVHTDEKVCTILLYYIPSRLCVLLCACEH
jgi:hypothetical protein